MAGAARRRSRVRRSRGSATRWARWARAITTSRCRRSSKSSTPAADAFDLEPGACRVSIHCGSRGLGHQIGTEFLKQMALTRRGRGLHLPDRELACAPINSGRQAVPRRDARGDQLRLGQPANSHAPDAASSASSAAGASAAAVRRVAQHLQSGKARRGRARRAAVRAPQGRHPRLRSGPPRSAGGAARDRSTGADRWQRWARRRTFCAAPRAASSTRSAPPVTAPGAR